jgi:hypothetical protein
MGWFIKNKKDIWEIHSTVTDSMIDSFDTQKECVKFIALDRIYRGKKQAIEELMTFPNGWSVNGERYFGKDKSEEYYNWLKTIYDYNTYEEYYEKIDKKLEELLTQ